MAKTTTVELQMSVHARGGRDGRRWYWSVTNPRPFIPHPNHVAGGITLTEWGGWRRANRAAARELRRIDRYESRQRRGGWRPYRDPAQP